MEQSKPKKMDTFRTVSFEAPALELKSKLSAVEGYKVLDKHQAQAHYPNAIQLQTPSGDVINLDFRKEGAQAVVTHVFNQDSSEAVTPLQDEAVLFANAVRTQYPEVEDIVEMSNAERGIKSP